MSAQSSFFSLLIDRPCRDGSSLVQAALAQGCSQCLLLLQKVLGEHPSMSASSFALINCKTTPGSGVSGAEDTCRENSVGSLCDCSLDYF